MSLSPAEIAYEQAHITQDQRPTIIAVISIFCGIAVATTIGRFVSRWFQGKTYALDDWLMLPGTIIAIVNSVAACFEAHYGYGLHLLAIPPENFEPLGKWEVVNLWSYIFGITFIKLSILALITRIFNGHRQQSKWFHWVVYFLVGWQAAWLVALCFAFGFQCQPFSSQWATVGRCVPPLTLIYSATILNSIHDVAVFILPQPIVWKLQMPIRKKFTISVIFMIGIVATIMGILKIAFVTGVPGTAHPQDTTYSIGASTIFTSMEPILAIVCGNLPAMPTLFQKMQLSELPSSIKSAVSRLLSASSSSSSKSSTTSHSDGSREKIGSSIGENEVIITSGWEVSKEKMDNDQSADDWRKKDAAPFV